MLAKARFRVMSFVMAQGSVPCGSGIYHGFCRQSSFYSNSLRHYAGRRLLMFRGFNVCAFGVVAVSVLERPLLVSFIDPTLNSSFVCVRGVACGVGGSIYHGL